MKKSKLIFILVLTTVITYAQDTHNVNIVKKNAIIDTILACFESNYVYPGVAKTLKDSLLLTIKNEPYSQINDAEKLLNQLSSDLRRIFDDRHIDIKYIESLDSESGQNKHSILSEQLKEKKNKNFNFKKAEWLPGNVGYIRLDRFDDPQYAGETVASAVNFISNCDAVIIDLRYNYGGEEKMVKYLASYFFSKPTLLNSLYFTKQDSTVQSWTDINIPFSRLVDKDLYILTSSNTASGAEAFTYALKNHKRAMVIGETTAGAAHWVEYFMYRSLNMEIKMPIARPINPITNTNWEKIGIKPDIEIQEYIALDKAYLTALNNLQLKLTDKSKLQELEWYKCVALERLKNGMIPIIKLTDYTGEYEDLKFIVKDNYLFWHQSDNAEFILLPISKDHFVFDDSDDYMIRFIRDKKGVVTGNQLLIKNRKENPIHTKTIN